MPQLRPMIALLTFAVACSSSGSKTPSASRDGGRMDGGGGDGVAPGDGGGDEDSSIPLSPWGIDTRPANATCVAPTKPTVSDVGIERVFPNLSFAKPVGIYQAPGDASHFYVIEQSTGLVRRFPASADATSNDLETVLTLSVLQPSYPNDEVGFLGFAFDPDYATNGYAYVMSNPSDGNLREQLDRYTKSNGSAVFDPASKKPILSMRDPARNHNGGHIAFGKDGLLYIGTGDGGGGGDPNCFAQDLQSLLGKFLRIDVHPQNDAEPYAVPGGNPFAKGGGLPEIYAWGLRNPWRWSFDRDTGELWAGDVGQNAYEEIDLIELGKNYGWNSMEGFACFSRSECTQNGTFPGRTLPTIPPCDDPSLVDPVFAYDRNEGATVTGGFVYRGSALPALQGTYVYADFGNGRIWGITKNGASWENKLLLDTDLLIASFGEDEAGELYVLDWAGGGVYRLVAGQGGAADTLPALLSQTGCVDASDPKKPVDALIPYEIRVPFWSDGATKQRWFAIPDGTTVHVREDGDFELPPGGVTMKSFWIGDRLVETRFFVRWSDGTYGGYTYRWNAEQTDATLLASSLSIDLGERSWYYPSRGECERCHHPAAGGHLGLESIQIDTPLVYPTGKRANQIDTLVHLGMLDAAPSTTLEALPRIDDDAQPLEKRARAYLHSNCSHCHRPASSGRGVMDMRFGTSNPMLCNAEPLEGDLGIANAKILSPGKPSESLLYVRMSRRDDKGMPPLASERVDEQGKALLDAWIRGLSACP